MNVINDYKLMLEKGFIDKKLLAELNIPEVRESVEQLYKDINELEDKYGDEIKELLILMTKFYSYKLILKMKIRGSVVPDSKDPENKYVQARGAVVGLNKKRIWVSHYLGPEGNYIGNNGKLIPVRIKNQGRVPVILKTIEKLLAQINEL